MKHGTHQDSVRSSATVPTPIGTQVLPSGAPSGFASGFVWSAAGVLTLGCAGSMGPIGCTAAPTRVEARTDAPIEPVSAELPPSPRRSAPARVRFSDEPEPDSAAISTAISTDAQTLAQGMPEGDSLAGGATETGEPGDQAANQAGLVDALAGSYEDDMKALAAMQANRTRPAETTRKDPDFNDIAAPTKPASMQDSTQATPPTTTAREQGGAPTDATQTERPTPRETSEVRAQPTTSTTPEAGNATSGAQTPRTEPNLASVAPVPATSSLANASLELPPAAATVPTDPTELTRLLAESLAKRGSSSTEPTRDWLAYAALAIGEPSLSLPKDFGSDLLPAERERIEKVHTAFAAVGRLLAQGGEIDQATAEGLVAALTGGPRLEIPKVEFCTKVESFGRFSPLGNDRFLARSNARFILYTELSGFSSELVDGEFVTRLATRVSMESERDGIEVWARQPAWTAVVDRSPTRRSDFFVGEIVSVSEYLSVGSYRLKIEIRDEASGRVAIAHRSLHIVADPSMAAVGD